MAWERFLWPAKGIVAEYRRWLKDSEQAWCPRPRTDGTLFTAATHVGHCLRTYVEGGEDALNEVIGAAHRRGLHSSDSAAWVRMASWREFLAYAACTDFSEKYGPVPRSPLVDTAAGTLLAPTLGNAVRTLTRRFTAHTLSTMEIGEVPGALSPAEFNAVMHLIMWGHIGVAAHPQAATHRDFTHRPLFPSRPGSAAAMRPSVISDVASRPPRPHDVKTPEFAGPPLFIRIGEHHTEYKPRSLVFNRPAWRTAKQIPPTRRALRDAERESLASRAMVRRLARSKPAARQKSLYDMTPEEYAAAEAAALRSTATDIFAPAAEPPPAKEPWHITANVAGVKALGEVPADSHHWSLRVNVAHVVGLGEDGQRPLLTVRENEFDTPGG